MAAQLTELRRALDAQQQQIGQQQQQIGQQQQQIKQLSDQVQGRDQQIQHLLQTLDDSQTVASAAATKADKQGESVTAFRGDLNDLKKTVTDTALSLQETQSNLKSAIESPLALHYRGGVRARWVPRVRGSVEAARAGSWSEHAF